MERLPIPPQNIFETIDFTQVAGFRPGEVSSPRFLEKRI
jgi:hypothetical protein